MSCGEKIQKALESRIETSKLKWEIKRYSDTNDFESLWELGNDRLDPNKNIIVVWDGFPSDKDNSPVALEKFITPMDWVFAYLHRHEDLTSKIAILDICSHEYPNSVAEFHQRILEEIKIEDHILFYSFNTRDFEKACNPLDIKHIEEVIDLLSPVSQTKLADLSKEMWNNLIENATKDNSRHSINNILDPLILGEYTLNNDEFQYLYKEYSTSKKAFYTVLKWHGIINVDNCNTNGFERYRLDHTMKLVLVDDQANYGWESLLNKWVEGAIDSKENANFIIEKLRKLERPHQLKLTEDNNGNQDEILLFDLYLFPSNEEKRYFHNVLDCANDLNLNDNLQRKIEELSRGLDDESYQDKKIDYLTLLPRIIAEIDPSIPIIIFSSTADKYLKESVEGYKNIYIFLKPTVLSENWNSERARLGQKRGNFTERIKDAKEWIQKCKRSRIHTFCRKFGEAPFPDMPDDYPFRNGEELRAELYIDETGQAGISKNFTIGGIYVVGRKNDTQAWNNLNGYLDSYTDNQGQTIWVGRGLTGQARENAKRRERNEISSSLLTDMIWNFSDSFYIRAICLTVSDEIIENGNNRVQSAQEVFRNILREKNIFSQPEFDRAIEVAGNNFTDQLIKEMFRGYRCRGWSYSDRANAIAGYLANNQDLLASIAQDYVNSSRIHRTALFNLIDLFLYVVSPLLGVSRDAIAIQYGTMTKVTYTVISQEMSETGIAYSELKQPESKSYFIQEDDVSTHLEELADQLESIRGVTDNEMSKLHKIADTVVSVRDNTNFGDLVASLYKYPGMRVTSKQIKPFRKAISHFSKGEYQGVLESIKEDETWEAIEAQIEKGRPSVRSYICMTLAKKACAEISNKTYSNFVDPDSNSEQAGEDVTSEERHTETPPKPKGLMVRLKQKFKGIFTGKDKA